MYKYVISTSYDGVKHALLVLDNPPSTPLTVHDILLRDADIAINDSVLHVNGTLIPMAKLSSHPYGTSVIMTPQKFISLKGFFEPQYLQMHMKTGKTKSIWTLMREAEYVTLPSAMYPILVKGVEDCKNIQIISTSFSIINATEKPVGVTEW